MSVVIGVGNSSFIDKYNEGIEKGFEKGRLEGRQEGILEMIRNFMKSTGNSVQDTFEMFKIPEADRGFYLEKLKSS